MKKSLFSAAILSATLLASCSFFGTSAKGVQGKTFVYSSCTAETVISGDSANFYVSGNHAGADKDAVVNNVVHQLYSHGTSTISGEIAFSAGPTSGMTWNGVATDVYEYNHAEDEDGLNATFGGYYLPLNSDFTSIHFVQESKADWKILEDKTFSCGGDVSTSKKNNVTVKVSNNTYFKDKEVKYDTSSKKLTMTLDVTYDATIDTDTTSTTIEYTLEYSQK